MVLIRADANEVIATGHVMRCLAIAKVLLERGEKIKFVSADHCPEQMILNAGFEVICLGSVWNDMETELDSLIEVVESEMATLLLVDSYYVTEHYLSTLRKKVKLAYIDDLAAFAYPVDFLINYNIFALDSNYVKLYAESRNYTQFALGCSFVPLRKEFLNIDKTINEIVTKVLITSGGTDNYNVVENFLERVHEEDWFRDMQYYVILGQFNTNKDVLQRKWETYENIHFLVGINNVSEYMKSCDIAVTAGGATTYELCACGIPSIMYTLADNQLRIVEKMTQYGIMNWVGDVREEMSECMDKIVGNIVSLKDDFGKRLEISKRMQQVVDGMGCERIAKMLMCFDE